MTMPVMTAIATGPVPEAADAGEAAALARANAALDRWNGNSADLAAAKVEIDAVLARNPRSAAAWRSYARYTLSNSYVSGKRYMPTGLATAERALDQAIALAPEDAEGYLLRGNLYRLQDRAADAEAALRRAEALGTQDPWLDLNWSDLLHDQGKHAESLALCQAVLARKPGNIRVLTAADDCVIRAYESLGRMEDADVAYRARIARTPEQAWPRGNYAAFQLCTRNQPEAAAASAMQALQLMDYGIAHSILATALYQLWAVQALAGHADAADQAWARAWANAPGDPARYVEDTCGKDAALPVLRALRDSGRVESTPALPAILAAADMAPEGALGIFGFDVVATGRKDGEIFLNSELDYRDPRCLTIRFTPAAASAFRKQHGEDPDTAFKGKRITVVGEARRVKIYFFANGRPTDRFYYQTHVVVTTPWQVEVEKADEPLPPPPKAARSGLRV